MSFTVDGINDLINDIQAMATAVGEEGANQGRILKAAAEPIHAKMKANAASDPKIISGALHGAIKIGPIRKRKSRKQITIGVHSKDYGDEPYPYYVEYGHGGPAPAPAHPYVRPAFDTEKDSAYNIMKEELRSALDRRGG